jgi:hypothetical protein
MTFENKQDNSYQVAGVVMVEDNGTLPDVEESESSITDPEPCEPVILRLVRAFLDGNYFYVLSAVLMMLGCYWLMPISMEDAGQFERRLKSLLLLQGYEVLVIVTACFLVARIKILGDAFTLFIIELVLLLDPTCFSNAFFTLKTTSGVMVNLLCCALVPVKLLILQRFLHIRIRPCAFGAILFATLCVYLGEWPLNVANLPISHFSYYSFLMWGLFGAGLLLPSVNNVGESTSLISSFSTERQQRWLRLYLSGIPLIIMAAHLFETQKVFDIPFFPLFLAPVILSIALVFIKMVLPKTDIEGFVVILDVLVVSAFIVSLPGFNSEFNVSIPQSFQAPIWVRSYLPLVVWGGASFLVYGTALVCWKRHTTLYRIGILLVDGIIYGLFKTGIPATINTFGEDHPMVILFLVWLIATAIAVSFQKFWTWVMAGGIGAVFITTRMAMWEIWLVPEGVQLFFLLLMVLYHHYGDPRKERYTSAFIVAGLALGRLIADPGWWQGCVVGIETIGLLAAGWWLRQPGYLSIGALQGFLFSAYIAKRFAHHLSLGLVAVGGALLLFGVGIAVSLQKKRLLDGLDSAVKHLSGPKQKDS